MIIFTPKEIIDLLSLRFEIPEIKGISKKTLKNIIYNRTTPRESTLELIESGLEELLVAFPVEDSVSAPRAKNLLNDLRQLGAKDILDWKLLVGSFRKGGAVYKGFPSETQAEKLILALEEISEKLWELSNDDKIEECKELLLSSSGILAEWKIEVDRKRLARVKNKRDLIQFTTRLKIDSLIAIISRIEEGYRSLIGYEGKSRYSNLAPKLKIKDLPNKIDKRIDLKRPVSIWFERVQKNLGFKSINEMATSVTGLGANIPTIESQKREIRRWKNGQYPSWPSIIGFIKNLIDFKYPNEPDVDKFDCLVDGLMSFTAARLIEAAFFTGVLVTQKVIPGVDVPIEGFDWDEKLVESYFQHFDKVLKNNMTW